MSKVRAVLVDEVVRGESVPGAIAFSGNETGIKRMRFCCPCGCGKIGTVRFGGPQNWAWDGNQNAPTITPSIDFENGRPGAWHGYLTAGEWVT